MPRRPQKVLILMVFKVMCCGNMVCILTVPQRHIEGRIGVDVHERSFRSSATVSTFLPVGLERSARASACISLAVFRGRRPAFVTMRSGFPFAVTTSFCPGCNDFTRLGE